MNDSTTRSMALAAVQPADVQAQAAAGPEADVTIRPAVVLPMTAARGLLDWLGLNAVTRGGVWSVGQTSGTWQRYDRPWNGEHGSRGDSELVGAVFVTYDTPRRHDVTLHRVQVTEHGLRTGWTWTGLVDDMLSRVGLSLTTCPQDGTMPTSGPKRDPFKAQDAYNRGG